MNIYNNKKSLKTALINFHTSCQFSVVVNNKNSKKFGPALFHVDGFFLQRILRSEDRKYF